MSVALLSYLEPLQFYLQQDGVSELCINNAGEVWLEKAGPVSYTHLTLPTN